MMLCLILSGGCGNSQRRNVEGNVTFNGMPLEKGYVMIRPEPGTASPSVGGEIVAGRFAISPKGGISPGKFRVEITASRTTDKKIRDPIRGMVTTEEQYIPAKYNVNSELELTVAPGNGNVAKSFALTN
jgi:hypothetical protein